jgi:drug/metabolite transporter (DMT)-like permease
MSLFAIGLVLLSAVFHALWNFFAKRAKSGPVLVWLFGVMEMLIYLPFVIYFIIVERPSISFVGLIFIIGSGALHLAYFLFLTKGYQVGDLSIVYPLSRAMGPLVATIAAILLFGERPTTLALFGAFLICGGVLWLTGNPRKLLDMKALSDITFASLTGFAIAAYTLWDAYAVSQLLIAPLLFQWGIGACRVLLLTPYTLQHWDKVEIAWERDKGKAALIAIFSPFSYILILAALAISPVSYVAPMRVTSTLIGVGLAAVFLKESDMARRSKAAIVMIAGVIALSLG